MAVSKADWQVVWRVRRTAGLLARSKVVLTAAKMVGVQVVLKADSSVVWSVEWKVLWSVGKKAVPKVPQKAD